MFGGGSFLVIHFSCNTPRDPTACFIMLGLFSERQAVLPPTLPCCLHVHDSHNVAHFRVFLRPLLSPTIRSPLVTVAAPHLSAPCCSTHHAAIVDLAHANMLSTSMCCLFLGNVDIMMVDSRVQRPAVIFHGSHVTAMSAVSKCTYRIT